MFSVVAGIGRHSPHAELTCSRLQCIMSQGVKNDHGDCKFKSEAARSRTRYHIVYWECASYMGIQFTPPSETAKTRGGPGLCPACSNVVDAYKCRLDNMQTSLRMCVDSCGLAFREDIIEFVCLSPAMAIKYDLRRFQRYNTASNALYVESAEDQQKRQSVPR